MTDAPATKAPVRKRGAAAATASKPAAAKAAPAAKTTPAKAATPKAQAPKAAETTVNGAGDVTKFGFVCDQVDPTKSYEKFTPPVGSGCTGTLYVPRGATEVRVLVIGVEAPTS